MLELVSSKSDMSQIFKHLDLDSIMEVLRQYLAHSSVDTKVAVLKWIHHLFTEAKDKVIHRSNFRLDLIRCMTIRIQLDVSTCRRTISRFVGNIVGQFGRSCSARIDCLSRNRQCY